VTRADRLEELAAGEGLDLLIVGDLVRPGDSGPDAISNIRWLTGFSGTSGLALVGTETRIFFSDFRYVERAAREVSAEFDQVTVDRRLVPEAAERLHGRVGFDDAHTSVKTLRVLEESAPEGVELVPAGGLVERLRRRKDVAELAAIEKAAGIADEVYEWLCERGFVGRTEREVARAAEAHLLEVGSEPAFPVIVAAGENSALPHAEASEREITAGELVLIDMGAQAAGYCSDCTRTFATGELGSEEREVYELVLAAQNSALEAIKAGVSGKDADLVAREPIAAAGHEEHFGHGLGHGVGLEVHEAPRLSQRSEETLEEGDVVTVEPGVYVPGRFGVRIEDLVTVTADGCRNLSGFSKELRVVE
jgi:Xaa-Pro aminopeptidase